MLVHGSDDGGPARRPAVLQPCCCRRDTSMSSSSSVKRRFGRAMCWMVLRGTTRCPFPPLSAGGWSPRLPGGPPRPWGGRRRRRRRMRCRRPVVACATLPPPSAANAAPPTASSSTLDSPSEICRAAELAPASCGADSFSSSTLVEEMTSPIPKHPKPQATATVQAGRREQDTGRGGDGGGRQHHPECHQPLAVRLQAGPRLQP